MYSYYDLTSCDVHEIFASGFVHFDVAIADVVFMPLERHVSVFLINKSNKCFAVPSTLRTQAKGNATSVKTRD